MTDPDLYYECPPETAVLNAFKNDNLTWKEVVGELIDNAFDAGATRIEIRFKGNKSLSIFDDGEGIDSIKDLVTVGKHVPSSTTRLGRYGIGFKSAACWLWGKVTIKTSKAGSSWVSVVDWDEIMRRGEWKFSQSAKTNTYDRPYTELLFEKIVRSYPSFDDLISEVSFIFSPALRHLGKQILFEYQRKPRHSCSPYELPPLEKIIEDRFEVNGKAVSLRAGVVKEGFKNTRPGFIYHHGFRVIEHGSLGANGYSVSRIAGTVQLGKEWSLGKNKSTISDSDRNLLDQEVYQRCLPILREAMGQASTLALRSLTTKVEAQIMDKFRSNGREARDKGSRKGRITPVDSGRERMNAEKIKGEGKVKAKASSGIKIDWMELYEDEKLIGKAEILPTCSKVTFNTLHPFVTKIQKDENVDAITLAAIALFVEQALREPQGKFPFARKHERLFDACSSLLSEKIDTSNEKRELGAA